MVVASLLIACLVNSSISNGWDVEPLASFVNCLNSLGDECDIHDFHYGE